MIIYFANRKMEILGHASTNLPHGFVIREDLKTEDVETGIATFSCTVGFTKSNRLELEDMMQAGNFVLRSTENENEFYTIIDAEIDTKNQEIYIYAEDAGLDLLNEIVGEYEATEAQTAEWYVNKFTKDSGFEIGINEIPDSSKKKLIWDSESTVTERLASIATQFGGFEVSYTYEIVGMGVAHKYINIYEKRGKDVSETLFLDRDIDRIITKKSVANIATALKCKGGIPENKEKPITLQGYEYDDGDFYISGDLLKSRNALEKWSRYQWEGMQTESQGHIVQQYYYDTTSQKTLCENAVAALKKICDMEVNYEVEIHKLPDNIRIGDRINIVDDAGELYLSTRILLLETSISKQEQKATLGEHLIKSSGISERVEELAQQFAEQAASRVFYTWFAYADDENGNGISLNPDGKAYLGTATNRLTEAVDISDPSVFVWAKVKGEDGKDGDSGKSAFQLAQEKGFAGTEAEWLASLVGKDGEDGEAGEPGADGRTSYVHIAYGTSITGLNFSTTYFEGATHIGTCTDFTEKDPTTASFYTWALIKGKDGTNGAKGDTGTSVSSTTRYYMLSASAPSVPTTNPPSGWTTTEPSYTDGSTNNLYFVDLTTYSNSTWKYTAVSLSSSYQAAKAAYEKAASAQGAASDAQGSAGDALADAKDAKATVDDLNGIITNLVQSGSKTSVLKQTADGWVFDMTTYENAIAEAMKSADYIKLGTCKDSAGNTVPCIELGESDSDFKVRITNKELQFASGSDVPAYIKNTSNTSKLMIKQAEVVDELHQGGFVWKKRANGNLGLVWKGVS